MTRYHNPSFFVIQVTPFFRNQSVDIYEAKALVYNENEKNFPGNKIAIYLWNWWQLDVIGIDEAQFFDDLYDFCREAADIDGKTVIVAGLDGDYLRYHLIYWHSFRSYVPIISVLFLERDDLSFKVFVLGFIQKN